MTDTDPSALLKECTRIYDHSWGRMRRRNGLREYFIRVGNSWDWVPVEAIALKRP